MSGLELKKLRSKLNVKVSTPPSQSRHLLPVQRNEKTFSPLVRDKEKLGFAGDEEGRKVKFRLPSPPTPPHFTKTS